ncbi:MAG: NAD(P)H-hydrate dehydratase [Gammaproteobacteria bacterium]
MKILPSTLYEAAAVRELDRLAIEERQIPGYTLMVRAGQVLLQAVDDHFPDVKRMVVLCGAGNNGGDGYVLARMARARGVEVDVVALADPARLKGDAALACATFREAGGTTYDWSPKRLEGADLIVDAIVGTGLTRPLSGGAATVVAAVNAASIPVLAVDLPTGLHADRGAVLGTAIRASVTVTFIGLKIGLFQGAGPDRAGTIVFDDLGVGSALADRVTPVAQRIDRSLLAKTLPRRRRDSHKGQYGHVLVIGGGIGMPGAARLAGEGALRAGAGRVTVATWPENVAAVVAGRPELMVMGIDEPSKIGSLLNRVDVVAIGPGLGTDGWAQGLMRTVEVSGLPMVLDADALNLIAAHPRPRRDVIMTPHPGEAATMLKCETRAVQKDRRAAVAALCERFGGVVALKGSGTLVARKGDLPWLCERGNPGMATAGMGDVLTGVIAGIAAQNNDLFAAARCGVLAHALAGDAAARDGERGLTATDLLAQLRRVLNASV